MFCHKCGTKVADDAGFCHNCGAEMVHEGVVQKPLDVLSANHEPKNTSAAESLPQFSAAPVQTIERANVPNDNVNSFKQFVDSHVKQTTKFQSAKELLNSRVTPMFVWICFGIPTIIGLLAGGPIAALLLGLIVGDLAAILADAIFGIRASIGSVKFEGDINTDELIQFLNEHLSYLSPYFHEWGYMTTSGLGIRGAIVSSAINSAVEKSGQIRLGTGFGKKQGCFFEISIKAGTADTDSRQMEYFFSPSMRLPWPLKCSCMTKAVPILQATMEYYLKKYKVEGENNNVLS